MRGKGGLTREVLLPHRLVEQLEMLRQAEPASIFNRGIYHHSHYAVGGGQLWSSSFSAASQRELGWSSGAHGERHSYTQSRMRELQRAGLLRGDALRVVSQEIGHFRPSITETYLR